MDGMRRTAAEVQQDNELLLKFYRQENTALSRAVKIRDEYIISIGGLKEFSDFAKAKK
jgi:hypothetical protein